jgi:hypothetical protein
MANMNNSCGGGVRLNIGKRERIAPTTQAYSESPPGGFTLRGAMNCLRD